MSANISFGKIANALKSVASDHILGVAADIYDTDLGKYQSEINNSIPTAYIHPSDGGNTGSFGPTANATLNQGGTFNIPYLTINNLGHVTAASNKTITLPTYTLPAATSSVLGGVKVGAVRTTAITAPTGGTVTSNCYGIELDSDNKAFVHVPWSNTTYSAGSGLSLSGTAFSLKTGYTTNGKNYKVQVDSSGNPFVNVPWTDNNTNTTYSAGLGLNLSGTVFTLKTGYTSNGKNYKVEVDTDGNPFVNVPWTDNNTNTTYTAGSGLSLSGTVFTLKTGYTTSGKNYKVEVDSSGNPFVNVPWTDNNTIYSAGLGLNLSGTAFSLKTGYTSNGKNYKVQVDSSGNPFVNVPWTDTNTDTNTTYTAGSGLSLSGTVFTLKTGYTSSGKNYKVEVDSSGNPFVNVPWTDNNTIYSAGSGLSLSGTVFTLKTGYTTSGKNYKVQVDSNGNPFVNVPWTDNNTIYSAGSGLSLSGTVFSVKSATTGDLGGVKVGAVRATAITAPTGGTVTSKCYGVELDSDSKAFVHVPWTNTTYSAGSGLSLSGTVFTLKTGYTTNGKNYKVQVDSSGNPFVNVPWTDTNTDTNTTYTAGSGLSLSGTVFTLKTGYTTSGKNYKVQVDSNGNPFVNVPWTDNNTNTTYTAGSGLSLSGTVFSVKSATTSELGGVKVGAVRTTAITAPTGGTVTSKCYGVELDSDSKAFVHVPWANTTYSAGSGLSLSGTAFSLKTGYTTSGKNYKVEVDSSGNPFVNVPWTDNNTIYSAGSGLSLSGTAFSLKTGYTTSGKYYKVEVDSSGNPFVHVPWTDNNTNTTYTAGLGLSLSGTAFSLKTGYTTNGKNYKVQVDSSGNPFVNVPWTDTNTDTNTTYTAGLGLSLSGTSFSLKTGYTSNGKNYKVQVDSNGNPFVNVPWTDTNTDTNTTYTAGSGLSLTGTSFSLKTGYTTSGKNYKVEVDSSGNPFVNVPWSNTNTTYVAGSGLSLSGTVFTLKTGYTTSGKNYKVQVDSNGNPFVNVPWTDNNTNTTYAAGSGLGLSGTVFSVKLGTGIEFNAENGISIKSATDLEMGGVKVGAVRTIAISAPTGGTVTSKCYGVELDSEGKAFVHVPWTDNNTNTTYKAGSGLSLSGTVFTLKTGYTTSGKNYKVQVDSNGNPFVNVPWTDNNTNTTYAAGSGLNLSGTVFSVKLGTGVEFNAENGISIKSATADDLGGIKVGAVRTAAVSASTGGTETSKYYGVELDSEGKAFVHVPWSNTNTTYKAGSGLSLSGTVFTLKTGYTTNGKNYKVQVDSSGNPYVNVPWSDNNTTYTAGSGLSLSGTSFSLKTGYTTSGKYYKVQVDSNGNPFVHVPWSSASTVSVSNKNATLKWNSAVTIATVGNTNITAKLPENTWNGYTLKVSSTQPSVDAADNLITFVLQTS